MNMRERIASTVHAKLSRQDIMAYLDGDFDAGDIADAVLEAMMKPTPEMVSAGIIERHDSGTPEAWNLATANIYRAMLTAAKG